MIRTRSPREFYAWPPRIAGLAAMALLSASALLVAGCLSAPATGPTPSPVSTPTAAPAATPGGPPVARVEIAVPDEGSQHLPVGTTATYQANPPASGPHWSRVGVAPVEPGFYEEPVRPEQWIHNLEHGYVVVLYDCGGPCGQERLDELRNLLAAAPPSEIFGQVKLVIAPYAGLPFPIAAIAWDVVMHFDGYDEQGLLAFYGRHVDRGPELAP